MENKIHRTVPRTAEAIALGVGILVVVVIGVSSYRDWESLSRNRHEVEKTRNIITQSAELLSFLKDAETGQRGYLLTGKPQYLEPYERILGAIPGQIDSLEALATDREDQRNRLAALKPLVAEKLAELRETIQLKQTKGTEAALERVSGDRGKVLMDQIRQKCKEIGDVASARLIGESAIAEASANRTRLYSTLGSVLLLALFGTATAIIHRATTRRQELIAALLNSQQETARAKDLLQTTLTSIGDAVIATDAAGRVTFLNGVAGRLTEWSQEQAAGAPLDEVFRIVNESSRQVVESPVTKALREGAIVGLANHTVLIGKNGTEIPIDDSAAPIWGEDRQILGVVLVFRDISQRRETEKALEQSRRESEQIRDFLQTTLASIGDAVIATDTEGRITFMNPVAAELTGWTREEAHGKPVHDVFCIVDEETLAKAGNPIEAALREGKAVGLGNHTLLVSKDGRKIAIDDSAAPIRKEDGELAGGVLIFRDITKRRRAEQELEASEARFRATFANAPVGMVITDVEGRVIQSNQAYRNIVGYTNEELSVVKFLSLTHPDDAAYNRRLFEDLLANRIPYYSIEKRIFRKNGRLVWVRAAATLLRDARGSIEVIGLVEDIEKRKAAEAALAARTRLAALGADTGAALTSIDDLQAALNRCCEAIVTRLDAAFARIWTLNPAENVLELQASAGIYTHRDGPHSRVPVGSLKIGRIARDREPHLTNDVLNDPAIGDKEWARDEGIAAFAGYPLLVEGQLVGVMGMFARHSLTMETLDALGSVANNIAIGIERKRAEQERNELLGREQAARRDAELSAQALARSNDDLRQFAHAASHDLRSPLRTVSTMTALLARRYQGKLGQEADELIGFITGGIARMDSLISDLLTFSQITEGDLPAEHVRMEDAVDEALTNLRTALDESEAVVTKDSLPTVLAHKTLIVQVLQNLIGNAIKYRSERPVEIHVSAEQRGSEYAVSVRDNGMGIDPKYADEVFRAFKRLHGSDYPGNGIGLATCKRIVERHGGTIWVESEPGVGSTFLFTLPVR